MPRYFFHTRTEDRLIRDATGLELPDIASCQDSQLTFALWSEAFERQFRQSPSFVITDAVGRVVFVTGE